MIDPHPSLDFPLNSPQGFLECLGETNRRRLLESARRVTLPAGTVTEFPRPVFMGDIVERGLVRAFQVSLDGRESTIRYGHPGLLIGVLPADTRRPTVFLQALERTRLLRLDPELIRDLYSQDLEIAHAVAANAANILAHVVRVVTVRTLGTMRERLAFDLLERASAEQIQTGHLVVAVTHDGLANSIGASRETVSRIISDLRRARVISTSHGRIRVDRPRGLVNIVQGLVT